MAAGFAYMFGVPLVAQIVAATIFVLTLSPIILGISDDAAWTFPWRLAIVAPSAFAMFVGILVLATIIAAMVPLLGRINSFYILLIGVITLMLVVALLRKDYPDSVGSDADFIPGFWFVMGILFIGGTATWLGIILSAVVTMPLTGLIGEDWGTLFAMPLMSAFGFIPVFIYGAWLAKQIAEAT